MQIAILLNQNNELSAFEAGGTVALFEQKDGGGWTRARNYEFSTEQMEDPFALREALEGLCQSLAPCHIIAARRFRGTYRVVFDRFGVSMWELEGFSADQLEDVLDNMVQYYLTQVADNCETQPSEDGSDEELSPKEQAPGCYWIDLTEVMRHKAAKNSQQILLPFFRESKFSKLEIQCEHIPKWFDEMLPKLNLKMEFQVKNNDFFVTVTPH